MKQDLTAFIQELSERQQTAERRLSELGAVVKALESRIAELSAPSQPRAVASPPQAAPLRLVRAAVTPEILVMLAAAATAFLGKEVRVRSARLLQPVEGISPWAQQGRVFLQASHHPHFR